MKNIKRIVMAVIVAMAMFVAFSFANNVEVHSADEHSHTYTNGLCSCGQCNAQHTGWTELSAGWTVNGDSLELAAGYYYLDSDIILPANSTILVANGTVTICLNGHVLASSSFGRSDVHKNVITVSGASTVLNITDCNSTHNSAIPVEHSFYEQSDNNGSNGTKRTWWVWDQGNSASNVVIGGVITGGNTATGDNAGAINVQQNATLNFYSGNVVGNISGGNGGAIFTKKGIINIYGGLIAGNMATSGGAIGIEATAKSSAGTLNMYGGTIQYNYATREGGGISTNNSTYTSLYLYGGTIKYNKANLGFTGSNGGGVSFKGNNTYVGGNLVITNNKVAVNSEYDADNNLFVDNSASKKISFSTDPKYAPKAGMNIGVTTSKKPEVDEITGESTNSPFSGAAIESYQKYFFADDSIYKIKTSANNVLNICLPVHKHNSISFNVELNNELVNSTEGKLAGELTTGNYYLEEDLYLTSPITITTGQNVIICLSNHGIIGNYTSNIFNVEPTATLEIYDCEQQKSYFIDSDSNGSYDTKVDTLEQGSLEINGGYITGGKTTGNSGSCINVNGGNITIWGGNIIGNEQINESSLGGGALYVTNGGNATIKDGAFVGNVGENGGAINVNDGESTSSHSTLTIYNCDIRNNKAKKGGAIYSSAESDLVIRDGEFKYNKASIAGGAIYNDLDTRLYIYDGVFNGNTSQQYGGAIYAVGDAILSGGNINNNVALTGCGVYITDDETTQGEEKVVSLGGTLKIENNINGEVQSNLYLDNDDNPIKIQCFSLAKGANIGITSKDSPDDGAVILSDEDTVDNHSYLFSDASSYKVIAKAIGNKYSIRLVSPLKVTYHSSLHNSGGVPVDNNVYIEEETVTILSNPNKLVREGYKLIGWNTDKDATEPLGSSFVIYENTDLYAIWEEKITLTFDTTQQEYIYDDCWWKFVVSGELGDTFTTSYFVNTSESYTGVKEVGTYDVHITRSEDSTYKKVDVVLEKAIKINPKSITPTINNISSKTFNREEITLTNDELKVFDSARQLVNGTDYDVSYENNYNAGTATVIVTLKGNYTGVGTKSFTINRKEITPVITGMEVAYFDVNGAKPGVNVKDGTYPLDSECDYIVEYTNNMAVGTGHLVVTCCGNYSGTVAGDFEILKKNFEPTVDDIPDQVYAKENICPELSVYDGETLLVSGTDYDADYSDNFNAGTATVVITLKGNYEGTKTVNFTIKKKVLTVNWSNLTFVYDGNDHKPSAELVGLIEGDEVSIVVNGEQTNVGDEYVAEVEFVQAQQNYMFENGNPTTEFSITQATTVITDLAIEDWIYFENENDPTANANFGEIKYEYSEILDGVYFASVPQNAGTYYVKAYVEETDNWSYAESVVEFVIGRRSVATTFCKDDFTYNGNAQVDSLSATFKNVYGADIALKLVSVNGDAEFKYAGTRLVTFTFNDSTDLRNYTFGENGSNVDIDSRQYHMKKANYDMSGAKWNYDTPFTYNGNPCKVEVIGLSEGVTVEKYTDNEKTNAGMYAAKVVFSYDKDNYNEVTLEDCAWAIDKATYDVTKTAWDYSEAFTYDKEEKTVLLKDLPTGVTVEYSGNVATNAGSYTAKITKYIYDEDNYNAPEQIEDLVWTINKATFNMDDVEWNYNDDFVYDGLEKTVNVIGLPEGLTVNCKDNAYTEANTYTAKVTKYNYDTVNYNEPTKIPDLTWEIKKATYNMNEVTWIYEGPFTYDGNPHKVVVDNLPEGVRVSYNNTNEKTNAGEYEAVAIVIDYDAVNYNEPAEIKSQAWVINKATIDMSNVIWINDGPFTYDGEEKKVEVIGLPDCLTVEYANNEKIQAGNYTASISKYNYDTANYNEPTLIPDCPWEIKKAKYDLTNVKWNYNAPFTYDGNSKTVEVTGLPEGITVKDYNGNVGTVAGKYVASATFNYDNVNYCDVVITDLNWEIQKATYDMSAVKWVYENAFTFDKATHKVEVDSLPEGVTVKTYENNEKVNAGSYVAKVKEFNYDTANYNAPVFNKTLTWEIQKATYDMSAVKWVYENAFTFDKATHKVEVDSLPEGVTVKTYENNEKVNAGSYVAKVKEFNYDTANYNAPVFNKTLTWEIQKANYDMSTAKWNYSIPFVYNGSSHKVEVIGLPEGVTVKTYENNEKVNAGSYVAKVKEFNYDETNYNEPTIGACNWTISLANYDMSNVKWDYENAFVYDGTQKSVVLVGLPEGVSATYENNSNIVVGSYVAKVTLTYDTANFESISYEPLNWEIVKADYDMTNVKWNYTNAFVYDGTNKNVELTNLPNGVVAVYENNEKLNAGSYKAKVTFTYDTANYNEPSFEDCDWIINKANYNVNVKFDSLTIPEDEVSHMITVVGDLPSGVSVEYYCNDELFTGAKDAGIYSITAKFVGDYDNYNELDDMNATLIIQATEIVVPIQEGKDKPDVKIEAGAGFPADVVIEYSNSVDDTEEKHTSTFDYQANKDKETRLKFDEEVSFVFELKLMREVDGQMVAIQPTDLDGIESIKVKILIPENVNIDELTRIIHVHSNDDLSVIEFDASKVDENRYYEIEISKLSEFAFIHKKDCSAHWGLITILAIYLVLFVVWVFILKNNKFDLISVSVTTGYGVAWLIFVFTACCYKCIIFAVVDFLVLIMALMLLGTPGGQKILEMLIFTKEPNGYKVNVANEFKSNREEYKRFNENYESVGDKNESYEEKKLDEMYEKLVRDANQPDNYNGKDKVEVVGVCFANSKKIYKYSPNGNRISIGAKVKVEGQNGSKMGRVIHSNYYAKPDQNETLKNIISVLN